MFSNIYSEKINLTRRYFSYYKSKFRINLVIYMGFIDGKSPYIKGNLLEICPQLPYEGGGFK